MSWEAEVEPIKNAFLDQVRGRARIWRLAFYLTLVLLLYRLQLPTNACDLMSSPLTLAKDFAEFGTCIFLLVGLTNRGRLLLIIVIFFFAIVGSVNLVHPRIPTNERRTTLRLQELHASLNDSRQSPEAVAAALNRWPFCGETSSGYCFSHSFEQFPEDNVRYSVTARPCFYCRTGQRSYLLEENGRIHYTFEDRSATIADPLVD
jgi:hypothetical protein